MTIERRARPPRDGQPQETRTSTRGKPCSTICCKRKEAAACSHASRYWVSACCSITTPPKSERLNSDFLPLDAQQQRTTNTIYTPNETYIEKIQLTDKHGTHSHTLLPVCPLLSVSLRPSLSTP